MYEFLNQGIEYNDLNEYEKNKASWLEEATCSEISNISKISYYRRLTSILTPIEVLSKKDIYKFSKEEMLSMLYNVNYKYTSDKNQFFAVLKNYMNWAFRKGLTPNGNPIDEISREEVLEAGNVLNEYEYITLDRFYELMYNLKFCTDVDIAIFTLSRYGVETSKIGKVKWEDVDRNNMVLNAETKYGHTQLPIDDNFLEIIDKARDCKACIMYGNTAYNYTDYGYIIKTANPKRWTVMGPSSTNTRIGNISSDNHIDRISVQDLRNSRKYDLLFAISEEKAKVGALPNSTDFKKVLITIENYYTDNMVQNLKDIFRKITDIDIDRVNVGTIVSKSISDETEEDDLPKETNLIDKGDSNYQDSVYASFHKGNKPNTYNHKYGKKEKKIPKDSNGKSEYPRDSSIALLALELAEYKCTIDGSHESFVSGTTDRNYVEVHHLIPIKFHYLFNADIDNEGNILVLCPNCHKKLHYGQFKDNKALLERLYDEHINTLKLIGLGKIKKEEFLYMYKNSSNFAHQFPQYGDPPTKKTKLVEN